MTIDVFNSRRVASAAARPSRPPPPGRSGSARPSPAQVRSARAIRARPGAGWRSSATGSGGPRRVGKPLLVLVVPDDGDVRWRNGQAFGELLNRGGDEAMALLALAEVICAPMSALRLVVPGAGEAEPTMVVVETHVVPARCRPVEARLEFREAAELLKAPEPADGKSIPALLRAAGRRLPAAGARSHRRADGGDPESAGRRPERCWKRAPSWPARAWARTRAPRGWASVRRGRGRRPRCCDRRPWYCAAGGSHPAETSAADRSRVRLAGAAVPAPRAGQPLGEHPRVRNSTSNTKPGEKQDDESMFACGMGRTPAISARFLDFLQADGSWGRD